MKYGRVIKKIWKYMAEYRGLFLISCAAALISAGLSLCIPFFTGKAVDCILGPSDVDFKGALGYAVLILVSAAVSALFQWIMNILNNRITYGVVRDMRNEAVRKIQRLPLKYLDNHPAGDIVSRVIADADQFADGLLLGFAQVFTGTVTIIGTLFFMLRIDIRIGLTVVVLTPLSLFAARYIATHTYRYALEHSDVRGRETAFVSEAVSGEKVIKAFNREERITEDFSILNKALEKASLKATFYSSLTNPVTRFVNNMIYAVVAVSGGFVCVLGIMTVGELTSLLSYAGQYTKPFNEISGVIAELQNAVACAERLTDLIGEEEECSDEGAAVLITSPEGRMELRNISFSYTPGKKLIQDFSLNVSEGQRIAIVGPTGCGKTTLINLLMRFYDPDSGSILLDGSDIRSIKRKSLREVYGMVLQDTWVKSGTIRENLCLGALDTGDEEMVEAAKLCHAHSFIKRLPKGYDTFISEEGNSLSAGQKQFLCITRAMLSKPSILILDEATSSIDTRTEIRIQEAFHRMMEGKTSFIVAHRLSTVRECDLILVMKDGDIVEKGSHEELIKSKGFYYDLYQSQFLGKVI